jgi:hypothetical protein
LLALASHDTLIDKRRCNNPMHRFRTCRAGSRLRGMGSAIL